MCKVYAYACQFSGLSGQFEGEKEIAVKLIILTPACLIFLAYCRTLTTVKFGKGF